MLIRQVFLYCYLLLGSGILFVNVYSSIIDAKIWGSEIPRSIEMARSYFQYTTPADFFKFLGAVTHIVGLLAIILLWKYVPGTRMFLIAAFLLFIAIDIFTLTYFIPRNEIMFQKMPMPDKESLSRVWREWSYMNWFRSLIALAGVAAICVSIHKIYKS